MRYLLTIVFSYFSLFVSAQEDTLYLSEVPVSGDPIHPFVVGGALKKIELSAHDLTLSDALSREGNQYFKSYGNQQLSTISMRGTSASQTNVLWHGIPVNYPTLGQMDFSQWPSWLLSSVELQPGSGGALFGSGSIGGTVLLDSDTDLSDNVPGFAIRGDVGSYGYYFTGVKANYHIGQLTSQTRFYRNSITNDFSYIYNGVEHKQDNAASSDMGFRQSLQWNHEKHQFTIDGIYTLNDREIQPVKGSTTDNHLETGNVRLAFSHEYNASKGSFNTSLGYIRNKTLYNNNQETVSNQYSVVSTYVFDLGSHVLGRVGFNGNIYRAQSESFQENLTDIRTGFFASMTARITHFWKASLSARQSIFKNRFPFNPSLNQEIRLFANSKSRLVLVQGISTGFRFPTLNDLYWVPGGNPDLKPERSLNIEGGFQWETKADKIAWGTSTNVFRLWSQDFILWRPNEGSIWSPENIQDVHISGIEYEGWGEITSGVFAQKITGAYSFTRSLNQTGNNQGNQLPYVPLHQGTITTESAWSKWNIDMHATYTGRRYTTLDNTAIQSVDGFFLINAGLERQLNFNKWDLNVGGRVNNLLDHTYENLINRAMPGRNFQLYILIKR